MMVSRDVNSTEIARSGPDKFPLGLRPNCDPVTPVPRRLRCSEVFGGSDFIDLDIRTNGLSVSVYSRSADLGGGGDVYYFSVCDSNLFTRIAIADVTGHGRQAKQFGAWMHDAIVERMNSLDGNGVLASLNQVAHQRGFQAITTAGIVGYYRSEARLYYAYAGHYPLLIRRRMDPHWWEARLPPTPGIANLPLGVLPLTSYEQHCLAFRPGDRFFFYTDGVVEHRRHDGTLFGHDRLLQVLNDAENAPPETLKAAVLQGMRDYSGDDVDQDDTTLVAGQIF